MIINIAFVLIWLVTRKNKNIARGWRTCWTVLGILNTVALAWNVLVLLALFSQV